MSDRIFFSTPKDSRAKIAAFMEAQNNRHTDDATRELAAQLAAENAAQREAEQARFSELMETVQLDSADRAELDREKENNIGGLIAHGMDYGEAVRQAELMAREAEERRKHTKATNILMNEQLRRNRHGATVQMQNSQTAESRTMNDLIFRAAGRK